ncbi:hypothetical protein BHM03_00062994 [Ensete ventricosum]|nr:hypothetical protein BHM03_00062994 [Ensete ventricosum]
MTSATSYLVWLQRKWVLVVARDRCCRGCGGQGKSDVSSEDAGDGSDRGRERRWRRGSSADDRWQREIAAIRACSVMQAMMLAVIEGEKGDGGNDRSSYGLRAGSSTTGEEKDFNSRWMRGYKRRQPMTTWLVDEEEGGGRWKETLTVSCKQ